MIGRVPVSLEREVNGRITYSRSLNSLLLVKRTGDHSEATSHWSVITSTGAIQSWTRKTDQPIWEVATDYAGIKACGIKTRQSISSDYNRPNISTNKKTEWSAVSHDLAHDRFISC